MQEHFTRGEKKKKICVKTMDGSAAKTNPEHTELEYMERNEVLLPLSVLPCLDNISDSVKHFK